MFLNGNMTSIEIKTTILQVINFYGELMVSKLVCELQIRGVDEDRTRQAFAEMIDEGVLDVDYDRQVIVGDLDKGRKYID
jgi:hypothetical protein